MPMLYFWMSAIGVIALWVMWTYLIQDLILDGYRAVLFECRADLITLVDSGEIRFDDPAYMTMRSVINSLIRYAHKITFGFYIMAALHAINKKVERDEVSVSQQMTLHISRQNPHAKQELLKIKERMNRACLLFIFFRSFTLQVAVILWAISRPFRKDNTQLVKDEVVNQVQKDALRASQWEQSQAVMV